MQFSPCSSLVKKKIYISKEYFLTYGNAYFLATEDLPGNIREYHVQSFRRQIASAYAVSSRQLYGALYLSVITSSVFPKYLKPLKVKSCSSVTSHDTCI